MSTKIVHIITGLGGGGAEQMVYNLVKKAKEHHTPTMVLSLTNVKSLEFKFKELNIEYHFLNISTFKTFLKALKFSKSLLKNNAYIFHCHMFHAVIFGVVYSIFYKKTPIFFTMHTNNVKQLTRKLLLFFTKWLRKKDVIFSKNSAKWYLKNSVVIPNGIDFKLLSSKNKRQFLTDDCFNFLFLGRLYEPKNPLILITFVKELLKKQHTNFKIHVVGDGVMKKQLLDLIHANQLTNYIKLHGFQKNVKPYLKSSHCLLLPSLWEGMPMSIIEAAAMKLPIIATPVGSIPDFLNTTNASVVEINTFPNSMIDMINNYENFLIKSEALYLQINDAFDIETVYKRHKELYKLDM